MTATTDIHRIVIVGGGLAAASAAEELRKLGYDGSLTILGSEPYPPYERPPLSKAVLLGQATPESAQRHPAAWYAENGVDLITDSTATAIDLAAQQVRTGAGSFDYDRLLLATGASPRRLALADEAGAEVAYLRTLPDALALRDRLTERLLIIGGGWIGLEVAAAARAAGGTVTVVEAAPLPLSGALGPEVAAVFADLHRDHGVDLRVSTTIAAIKHDQPGSGPTRVRLSDDTEVTVDVIVVGIGAEPNTDLAVAAGLATDNGVLVDARLCSSDPQVYAAGDIANHDHPLLGRLRVEHWDNAIEQGRHAARSMLGATTPYTRQPYFYTDQYDLGMEYVGHTGPTKPDEIQIRGDLAARRFTAWWIRNGTVVAGMHVNDWDAIDQIRQHVGGPATNLPGSSHATTE